MTGDRGAAGPPPGERPVTRDRPARPAGAGARGLLVHHAVSGPPGAPPLLLLNSLGTSLRMWDPQVPALAARFRVIRFDARGHGESPVPSGPYTIEDLGADVLALLDRLGVARAHVCGLSLGGMVGMWLARYAPDRVDRLVLCCTSARFEPPRAWAERARLVRSRGVDAIADAVVARWFTPAFARRHPARLAAARAMLAATPAEGYAACCGLIEHLDLRPALAGIRAATLVVVAADDRAAPPEHGARIAAGIPGASLAVVPDAAHLAGVERPDRVTDLLLTHLTEGATW